MQPPDRLETKERQLGRYKVCEDESFACTLRGGVAWRLWPSSAISTMDAWADNGWPSQVAERRSKAFHE